MSTPNKYKQSIETRGLKISWCLVLKSYEQQNLLLTLKTVKGQLDFSKAFNDLNLRHIYLQHL